MKRLNVVIYCVLGAGAILYGVAALLFPATLMKEAGQAFPLRHILREEGATAVFVGLMAFWCIFNYERRQTVHYFLIVLAALFTGIHWYDFLTGHLTWMAPLYNTVPFVVLLIMAVLNRRPQRV